MTSNDDAGMGQRSGCGPISASSGARATGASAETGGRTRQLRGYDPNVHGEAANQGDGPVSEQVEHYQSDRYADLGAGIWRWCIWSLLVILLWAVVLTAATS